MQVKTTRKFLRSAERLMSSDALQDLIDELAVNPEIGAVIQGTGGIRKVRWKTGKDNKGKSGGVRVLYYYEKNILLVLLITLYKKTEKENISDDEKNQLKKLLPELVRSAIYE